MSNGCIAIDMEHFDSVKIYGDRSTVIFYTKNKDPFESHTYCLVYKDRQRFVVSANYKYGGDSKSGARFVVQGTRSRASVLVDAVGKDVGSQKAALTAVMTRG